MPSSINDCPWYALSLFACSIMIIIRISGISPGQKHAIWTYLEVSLRGYYEDLECLQAKKTLSNVSEL